MAYHQNTRFGVTQVFDDNRASLPVPPPSWANVGEKQQSSPAPTKPARSSLTSSNVTPTTTNTAPNAAINFVVLCHGLIQLPAPVPTDKKMRLKLMKTCAKSLQTADGRFVLLSIQPDCVRLYGKSDPSTILYQLPFGKIDLIKLSQKDRTFFYLTVNTSVEEFAEKERAGSLVVSSSGAEMSSPLEGHAEPSTISVCYVFHAINHLSATRLFNQLKLQIERYQRENARKFSQEAAGLLTSAEFGGTNERSSSGVSLLGDDDDKLGQQAELSFWEDLPAPTTLPPNPPASFDDAFAEPKPISKQSDNISNTNLLSSIFDSMPPPQQQQQANVFGGATEHTGNRPPTFFPSNGTNGTIPNLLGGRPCAPEPLISPPTSLSQSNPFSNPVDHLFAPSSSYSFSSATNIPPQPQLVTPRHSHSAPVHPSVPAAPQKYRPFVVQPTTNTTTLPTNPNNPFGSFASSDPFSSMSSSSSGPMTKAPNAPLENSGKDRHVMPCTTMAAKEKNGQQFFNDQFNDFLSATVKNHFTTSGPSSNSNLLN